MNAVYRPPLLNNLRDPQLNVRQSASSTDHISRQQITPTKERIPRLPNWVMGQLNRYLYPLFLFEAGSRVLLNTKGEISGSLIKFPVLDLVEE